MLFNETKFPADIIIEGLRLGTYFRVFTIKSSLISGFGQPRTGYSFSDRVTPNLGFFTNIMGSLRIQRYSYSHDLHCI